MTRRITLAALSCLLLAPVTGCDQFMRAPDNGGKKVTREESGPPEVEVFAIQQQNMPLTVEVPATVEGLEQAELMSRIDGYVELVHVDIGDAVTKGQVLATLDVQELLDDVERKRQLVKQAEAEVDSQLAQVALADARREEQQALLEMRKVELKRMSALVERGALNRQKLDEAEFAVTATNAAVKRTAAEVTAAQAEVASAEAHRGVTASDQKMAETMAGYREIKAPFDGLITSRMVDAGAFVRPATSGSATPLFRITRIDQVRVTIYISMDSSGQLNAGDPVVLRNIEALPGEQIDKIGNEPLVISRCAKAFEPGSRMMQAEIDIDNSKLQEALGIQLKPGDYGMAQLTLKTWEQVLTAPRAAVGTGDDGKHYVVQVDTQNNCHKIPVEVAFEKEDIVALTSAGIQAGDRLVAKGPERISDGTTLAADSVRMIEPEELNAPE